MQETIIMLYEFKSRASGSIIMKEDIGDMVLRAGGLSPSAKGIITAEQIPAVLAKLRQAIAAGKAAAENPESKESEFTPSLAMRSITFLELLERSQAAGKDVTWGA
jgi:hypothetical protein